MSFVVVVVGSIVGVLVMAGARRDRVEARVLARAGTPATARRSPVPLAASPSQGPDDALVTVVEFGDLACPFTARAAEVRRRLLDRYRGQLRWVFKQFPGHWKAARTAVVAARQGRFWPFAERVLAERRLMPRMPLTPSRLVSHARAVGVDLGSAPDRVIYPADATAGELGARVLAERRLGRSLGVEATPNFFVNGRRLIGYYPLAYMDWVIRQELVWAKDLVARGTSRDRLYSRITGAAVKPKQNLRRSPGGS